MNTQFLLYTQKVIDENCLATPTGIEPVLSDVTDRCFSQLNYGAICNIQQV